MRTRTQRNTRKYTPAQRKGFGYEKRVKTRLEQLLLPLGWRIRDHVWVEHVQPDFVLESPGGCLLVVEVKLTQTDCEMQLAKYKHVLGCDLGIQICRRLLPGANPVDFWDASDGDVVLWWI